MRIRILVIAYLTAFLCVGLRAQPADIVVVNAKIATLDGASRIAQALAVRNGRLLVVGTNAEARTFAGGKTRVIDAGGRTIVPGLIDSHIHALRAGLSYATEVNWIDVHTIPEAMERLRVAANRRPTGSWIVVAGGWTELQFSERRKPTLEEVQSAVGDHPTWIQMFYSHVLVTPPGLSRLGVSLQALPKGLSAELGSDGMATGWMKGGIAGVSSLFDRLPRPTQEENVEGLKQFFSELNRLGVTGLIDAGGFNVVPAQYQPLFQLWSERKLTVRIAYHLFAQQPGQELTEFQSLTQMLPMGFGDEMLKFNGLGERITISMYNNNQPDEQVTQRFLEVLRWAARRGLSITVHWQEGSSAHHLLSIFEQVNREIPIVNLRWSIAHLDNATADVFVRMKNLGVGWTMQDYLYLAGDRIVGEGSGEAAHMPPIMTALNVGVRIGAGTDAHRVASYNPFVALQWMLDGRTVGGQATRGPEETPSREQALRMYTEGSAWFSFDDDKRGTLERGKAADFAVLSRNYFGIPVSEISHIESLLTVVGGKVVHAKPPFSRYFHNEGD